MCKNEATLEICPFYLKSMKRLWSLSAGVWEEEDHMSDIDPSAAMGVNMLLTWFVNGV